MLKKITTLTLSFIIFSSGIFAEDNLPVPRWVSTKGLANMRMGPSPYATIKFQYQIKGYPFEVRRQNTEWRFVRDPLNGTEGWMAKQLFSGKRYVITSSKPYSYGYKSKSKGIIKAKLSYGVQGEIINCDSNWCYVSVNKDKANYKLYLEKKDLYGVYDHEIID
jgi:SH3-like domain-containing protein